MDTAEINDVIITIPNIHKAINLFEFLAGNIGFVNFANTLPKGLKTNSCLLHTDLKSKIIIYTFAKKIAPCRTFCEKYQVDYLRSIGLIKGGSLDNAVVLDGENLLNPEGFRVDNECVNHKTLDAVGDMYTSGYPILGKLTAQKSGHYHNNELLKQLFADSSNYEIVEK